MHLHQGTSQQFIADAVQARLANQLADRFVEEFRFKPAPSERFEQIPSYASGPARAREWSAVQIRREEQDGCALVDITHLIGSSA